MPYAACGIPPDSKKGAAGAAYVPRVLRCIGRRRPDDLEDFDAL
ncbi:hypothetical protein L083_2908 [Actinoplanes sp. N902-109]|nr:hypothetical protein L083_2908 [Actinoplanes sp. N902-109]